MSRRPRANNLGTQFGERTMSRVQEVTFARAQPMRANQTLMVRYDVSVTPTMLFLGPDGRELVPRIVGINTPELFGGRVDAAIEAAAERLRALLASFTPPTATDS